MGSYLPLPDERPKWKGPPHVFGVGRQKGQINKTTRIQRHIYKVLLDHGREHALAALDELRRDHVAEYCKLLFKNIPVQLEVGNDGNAAAVIIIERADDPRTVASETVRVLPSQ